VEGISNRVEEVDGQKRVYCANHEDPACGNGDDKYGFAPAELVVGAGWLKVDDALACTAYCAAKVAGHDEDVALDAKSAAFYDDPITEEEVAAMSTGPGPQELDLSVMSTFSLEGGEE
jgi:hypothetical protein